MNRNLKGTSAGEDLRSQVRLYFWSFSAEIFGALSDIKIIFTNMEKSLKKVKKNLKLIFYRSKY